MARRGGFGKIGRGTSSSRPREEPSRVTSTAPKGQASTAIRARTVSSIGTSGNVYPAAGFVAEARANGAHTVELNLEPSEGASLFAEAHHGPASQVVPMYVDRLLDGTA